MDLPALDLNTLDARVRRLEKQNRVLRILLLVAVILLAGFPTLWFIFEQGTLESRSFVLVDGAGKHRAVLALSNDGSPSLVFYDKDGKLSILLNSKSDGTAGIGLFDNKGSVLFKAP